MRKGSQRSLNNLRSISTTLKPFYEEYIKHKMEDGEAFIGESFLLMLGIYERKSRNDGLQGNCSHLKKELQIS